MTEKEQITIYELLPLLKFGFVAMDKSGYWGWCEMEPQRNPIRWIVPAGTRFAPLSTMFNIAPFDGDWKDSLMEVK